MLQNSKALLKHARQNQYALPQWNINNLEWTKYILEVSNEEQVPVILGVSESAVKYMGGFFTVMSLVRGLIQDLKVTVPVVLHLDHGHSLASCKEAMDAGFTSVMIDGSHLPLEENIALVQEVVAYAAPRNVSVEAELGHVGSQGVYDKASLAVPSECCEFVNQTKVDALAPAIGNVHGIYQGPPELDFKRLKEINDKVALPLVLHGGSGLSEEEFKTSLALGIAKININTELQRVWNEAVRTFIQQNEAIYDPRQIISSGERAFKSKMRELLFLFATAKWNSNRAE